MRPNTGLATRDASSSVFIKIKREFQCIPYGKIKKRSKTLTALKKARRFFLFSIRNTRIKKLEKNVWPGPKKWGPKSSIQCCLHLECISQ